MRVELVSQDEGGLDPEGTREPCQRLEQEKEYLIANPGYRLAARVCGVIWTMFGRLQHEPRQPEVTIVNT